MSEDSVEEITTEVLSHASKLQLKRQKYLAAREARKERRNAIRAARKLSQQGPRRIHRPSTGRRCCGRR